jgi:hypothetical protein
LPFRSFFGVSQFLGQCGGLFVQLRDEVIKLVGIFLFHLFENSFSLGEDFVGSAELARDLLLHQADLYAFSNL